MCNALFRTEHSHRTRGQFTIISDQIGETMTGLIVNSHEPTSKNEDRLTRSAKWKSPYVETLTPRYTRKAQADRAPGFADKALSERWRSADKAQ
jgi:hypothetical protein